MQGWTSASTTPEGEVLDALSVAKEALEAVRQGVREAKGKDKNRGFQRLLPSSDDFHLLQMSIEHEGRESTPRRH